MRARSVAVVVGALATVLVACSSFGSDEAAGPVSADASSETSAGDGADGAIACDPTATASDSKNCGTCGHDCLGGACVAGACQPVRIGTSTGEPVVSIAIGATHVVWMTTSSPAGGSGSVYACPRAGCAGQPPVVAADKMTGRLTGNGSVVYASFIFGDNGFARVEGESLVAVPTLSYHKAALRLAMHASTVYVDAYGEAPGAFPRSVFAFTEPSTEKPIGVFAGGSGSEVFNTDPFVVTDKSVFLGAINTGRIVRCQLDDCTAWTDFVSDTSAYAHSMATDDKRLFWTPGPDGHVYGCDVTTPTCSGMRTEIGPAVLGSAQATFLTVHGETLYVTTTGGDVLACDAASCGSTVRKLAHEDELTSAFPSYAEPLAADDVSVYYVAVDSGGGDAGGVVSRIMRVAR